eukprot:SAG25_NODE_8616_length_413_cov_0.656051_1_plen_35_part_10
MESGVVDDAGRVVSAERAPAPAPAPDCGARSGSGS